MDERPKLVIEAQHRAAAASRIARTFRFAIIDNRPTRGGMSSQRRQINDSDEQRLYMVLINDRESAMHYAASRALRDELK